MLQSLSIEAVYRRSSCYEGDHTHRTKLCLHLHPYTQRTAAEPASSHPPHHEKHYRALVKDIYAHQTTVDLFKRLRVPITKLTLLLESRQRLEAAMAVALG